MYDEISHILGKPCGFEDAASLVQRVMQPYFLSSYLSGILDAVCIEKYKMGFTEKRLTNALNLMQRR